MLIMTQDRVSGLAANKSPLRTYGPGNTRDESNRNSWVSSDGNDKLTINCLGQVNGLFLGRYQADEVRLTYQGDEIFSNKTSSGLVAVGYANGSNGVISGTIASTEEVTSEYYYTVGTVVTIALSSDSTYMNVNDIITTLPQVEDSVPWWATLVQYGFIATSIIGVLVLLWYLGLGYPIKALMRNFSSLIPSSKRSAAKLLVKANDPESETTTRELIAVLRATDPDFNAAYQKEKQK